MVDFNPFWGPDLLENFIKLQILSAKDYTCPYTNLNHILGVNRLHKDCTQIEVRNASIKRVWQTPVSLVTEILLWVRLNSYSSFSQPVQLSSDSLWMLLLLQGARPVRSSEFQTSSVIYTKTEQGESGDQCIKRRMRTRCLRSGKSGKKGSCPRGLLCGLPLIKAHEEQNQRKARREIAASERLGVGRWRWGSAEVRKRRRAVVSEALKKALGKRKNLSVNKYYWFPSGASGTVDQLSRKAPSPRSHFINSCCVHKRRGWGTNSKRKYVLWIYQQWWQGYCLSSRF